MKTQIKKVLIVLLSLVALIGTACTFSLIQLPSGPTQPPIPVGPSATPQPSAQTTFTVVLPEPLGAGESLGIAILDEVTGLSLNPTLYPMSARDTLTYTAVLPLRYALEARMSGM